MPISAVDDSQSVYNKWAGRRATRISAVEAAGDSAVLTDHVRVGNEVLIENDSPLVAVLRPAAPVPSLDKVPSASGQEAQDEGWERVPSDLMNNLDHCLYVCEAQ